MSVGTCIGFYSLDRVVVKENNIFGRFLLGKIDVASGMLRYELDGGRLDSLSGDNLVSRPVPRRRDSRDEVNIPFYSSMPRLPASCTAWGIKFSRILCVGLQYLFETIAKSSGQMGEMGQSIDMGKMNHMRVVRQM